MCHGKSRALRPSYLFPPQRRSRKTVVWLCLGRRVRGSEDSKDQALRLAAWSWALYLQSSTWNIRQGLDGRDLNSILNEDTQVPYSTEKAQPRLRVSAGAELTHTQHPDRQGVLGSRSHFAALLGSFLESSPQRNPGPHPLSHPPSLPNLFLGQLQSHSPHICTDSSKETLTPFHLTFSSIDSPV